MQSLLVKNIEEKILDNWVFKNLILLIPLDQLRNIQNTLKIKMKLSTN